MLSRNYYQNYKGLSIRMLMLCFLDCDAVMRSKATLKTHVQHHSGDKMCACSFCGAFFANNTKLLDHVTRRQEGNFFKII